MFEEACGVSNYPSNFIKIFSASVNLKSNVLLLLLLLM